MKNPVGKNIVKLRKERGLSQEMLAKELHVTRQAVSNWETGRSQPDLDMLEALAQAFQTDILVVIYGQLPPGENEDIKALERIRHLRLAVIMGLVSLAAYILFSGITRELNEVRSRTYNAFPYIIFTCFVSPFANSAMGITLMHGLSLISFVRITDSGVRKKVRIFGFILIFLYVVITLWSYGMIPLPIGSPVWMWYLSASIFPQALFFLLGILFYLGTEQ